MSDAQTLPMLFTSEEAENIQNYINKISYSVFRNYLPDIKKDYKPIPFTARSGSLQDHYRILKIKRWVTDPNERSIDKLKNTYSVLANSDCRLALIFHRTETACDTYFAVFSKTESEDSVSIVNAMTKRFESALKGNFPGCKISGCKSALDETGITQKRKAFAIITDIAAEKSEKFVSQGIEKLIDAYAPAGKQQEYTLVLLCEPASAADIERERQRISDYYSVLSPCVSWQVGTNASTAVTLMESVANGTAFGVGGGVGFNIGGVANVGVNVHADKSKILSQGKSESKTEGVSRTVTYTNHQVKTLLERLDEQMKRLSVCEAMGMWRFAAYVLSDDNNVAANIAEMYRSLTQGGSSYLEKSAVNCWTSLNDENKEDIQTLCQYLQQLEHPRFRKADDSVVASGGQEVYATAFISGDEIAHALNMPGKSVPGLPVFRCARFARNIERASETEYRCADTVPLGKIYHMRETESNSEAFLDKNQLASHTFITGSTGAGKSNTIYTLLDRLCPEKRHDVHFLVIEPAKGEYKDVFGGRSDVKVFGTNPNKSELLQLNPFTFPDDIHVLEHIDRLVEIFNACWPMYAAMPAVLKDAIESAYLSCGWSLTSSTCEPRRYPTFATVLKKLPEIVHTSAYSADTKGDYIGALVTRVHSLTNGINGQILCAEHADVLDDATLFDSNVIIDLSRTGSMETKALLMGVLMIKLQEYRMAHAGSHNNDLKHITVLEEAHDLLRRTDAGQAQESANLQGKAVEMLTNAIAEMRTYGEGFVIADQAPGLLDMAVNRNTNTKIILRLPDQSDRELVGKAAGLNDEQIAELARLETGVAAVFQNHWLEPILCKVDAFKNPKPLQYTNKASYPAPLPEREKFIRAVLGEAFEEPLTAGEFDSLAAWIQQMNKAAELKGALQKILVAYKKDVRTAVERPHRGDAWYTGQLLYHMVDGKALWQRGACIEQTDVRQTFFNAQIAEILRIDTALADTVRRLVFVYAAHETKDEQLRSEIAMYGKGRFFDACIF